MLIVRISGGLELPVSLEQFVRHLTDSGLAGADEVAAWQAASQATDAEQFARELVRQKKLTAFQAQQLYSGRGKSLVLGNYVVLDKLGQGGMGMVLKALHRRMQRLVALKVLSPAVTKTKDLVARFHREVQAAARLEHPNIVAAYDADEANGTHFLVMQYVEGRDLSSIVKSKGPFPLDHAIDCVLQAARGLEYAHQRGVIHRDIKPANLLLDAQGTVKILDMGLARIEGEGHGHTELTSTGAVMGTVDYMAPEQALSTKQADARSDIYSLGITLWYLLVGRPAFEGDSLMARMLAHREAPIPSLAATLQKTSPHARSLLSTVDAVFQKMIAKRADDRYLSMAEVVAAFEACWRGEAPAASNPVRQTSEDSRFSEFLLGLAQTDAGLAPAVVPQSFTQVQTRTIPDGASAHEATLSLMHADQQTDGRSRSAVHTPSPQSPTQRQRNRRWLIAVASGVGAVIVMGLVVAGIRSSGPSPQTTGKSVAHAAAQVANDQKEREVLAWLLDAGGSVRLQEAHGPREITRAGDLPSEPLSVEKLNLSAARLSSVEALRRLADVRGSYVLETPTSLPETETMRVVSQLPSVQTLMLSHVDPAFTAETAEALGGSQLSYLILFRRDLRPGCLAALKQLPKLTALLLLECSVDREVLQEVMRLPSLQALNLQDSDVTDQHLAGLTLPQLASLALFRTPVTAEGVAAFRRRHPYVQVLGIDAMAAEVDELLSTTAGRYAVQLDPGAVITAGLEIDFKQPFTVECCVKLDALPTQAQSILWDFQAAGQSIMRTLPDAAWQVVGTGGIAYAQCPVNLQQRVHLAQVFDGEGVTLFVDGKPSGQRFPVPWREGAPKSAKLAVANISFGNEEFRGTVREIRVSRGVRYLSAFVPELHHQPDSDTLLLLHCDEGAGDLLNDASSHRRHGRMVGGKWVRIE